MRCPGQDKRYWSGAVIFEVPCPKCGVDVEIFQDESSGRCTGCGHKFNNPKRDLSCAEWCAYAEECLGFAPKRPVLGPAASHNLGEGALAGHLLQAAKDSLADEPPKITRTMVAFQHARALAAETGGDARIIMAATVLMEVGRSEKSGDTLQDSKATSNILQEHGLDQETIDTICRIIDNWWSREQLDSIEFAVVSDSQLLSRFVPCDDEEGSKRLEKLTTGQLKTEPARQRAAKLFRS